MVGRVTSLDAVCAELSSRATFIEVASDYLIAQCDHATLAAAMTAAGLACDALIVDAPYSARTHSGHDAASDAAISNGRRAIDYPPWSAADVADFVAKWAPVVSGWICSITDDVLSPEWRASMESAGRCGFAPLPLVQPGSRVRLSGDGPSSITTWVVVSRPRNITYARWGTLRGAYIQPGGAREVPVVVGGKTGWAMRSLVSDYSRPGDLVCDSVMGGGTTLVAAVELGRRAIGCEPDAGRFAIAAKRLREARRPLPGLVRPAAEQAAMDLGGER